MARIDLATQFTDVRARVDSQPTTPTVRSDGPKYRRLTRKETLLRADQLVDLSALARFRMKQRRVRTERITENSLVRIAVDLLLDNQDLLEGSTEDDLRTAILSAVARHGGRPKPASAAQVSRPPEPPEPGTPGRPEPGTPARSDSDTPARPEPDTPGRPDPESSDVADSEIER